MEDQLQPMVFNVFNMADILHINMFTINKLLKSENNNLSKKYLELVLDSTERMFYDLLDADKYFVEDYLADTLLSIENVKNWSEEDEDALQRPSQQEELERLNDLLYLLNLKLNREILN